MKSMLLIAATVLSLAAAPTASAAKTEPTFSVNQTNIVYGDTVTFSSTYNNARMISVQCFALDASGNLDPSTTLFYAQKPVGSSFTLTGWGGAAASCAAVLWSSGKDLARTYFAVSAAA